MNTNSNFPDSDSSSSSSEPADSGRRTFVVAATVVGAAVALAAPAVLAQTAPTRKLTLSYYPWITQSIAGPVLRQAMQEFNDLLQTQLRSALGNATQLELLPELDIPDQLTQLEAMPGAGDPVAKIGLLNPLGYALL